MRHPEKITAIGASRLPYMNAIDLPWPGVGNKQDTHPRGISPSNCYFKLGFDWGNSLGRDSLGGGMAGFDRVKSKSGQFFRLYGMDSSQRF